MGAKYPDPGIARKIVKTACPHDCPDTCGMRISVENGVAVKVEGAKDMPFTQGTLCTNVARYLDRTYSNERVLYPLKRVGAKGEGRFERISWDEALDTIAAKFKQIAAVEPQSILPCSYAGTMGLVQYASMDRRFFHKLGAFWLQRPSHCPPDTPHGPLRRRPVTGPLRGRIPEIWPPRICSP